MDTPTHGMDMATSMQFPQQSAGLPVVRVEVRSGPAKPVVFDVNGEEFLIGSVPGCDLRLPGTNLPPVVCLIARQADGVRLRKLAPTLPVLVNGQPIGQSTASTLVHGDCISIGNTDIQVAIEYSFGAPPAADPLILFMPEKPVNDVDDRRRQLDEQARELEAERLQWHRRRDEIQREMQDAKQSASSFDRNANDLAAHEQRLSLREQELERRAAELNGQRDDLIALREETLQTRRELNERFTEKREQLAQAQQSVRESLESTRQREANLEAELNARRQAFDDEMKAQRERAEEELRQWHNKGASGLTHLREQMEADVAARLKQRTGELDRFQLSLREAAVQLREKKHSLDEELAHYEPRRRELLTLAETLARKQEELEFEAQQLQRDSEALVLDQRVDAEPLIAKQHELGEKEAEYTRLLEQLEADRELAAQGKAQYEQDLIRLDRWQVTLDEREQQLGKRATAVDQRLEHFQRDGADLEDQVVQIDAREEALRAEEMRLGALRDDLDQREQKLNERLAQIEGQQVMLATLRTRLEHTREEQRQEAAKIAEERARLDEHANQSKEALLDAERLREELAGQQQGQVETEKVFRERSEMLQQAVQRMRDLQQNLRTEDERLVQATAELTERTAKLNEYEAELHARAEQLVAQQHRLDEDRQALKQREESFFLTEGTRESLQEQLRRRAEELITRGQELDARHTELETQRAELAAMKDQASGHLEQAILQSDEMTRRDEEIRVQQQKLAEAGTAMAEQRRLFDEAQAAWQQKQQEADARTVQAKQEVADLKQALATQAENLFKQVPDMETRAQAALEKTTQAREALRGQMTELHGYAKQSQDELETVRAQIQAEIERMRHQESTLSRSRTEHRHAVASFRQQLLEWQGRFGEMKQMLAQGETRIERREKDIDATTQQLAKQAEELEQKERDVAERRGEMERHLGDMREWYRKKLRELVESRSQRSGFSSQEDNPVILPMSDSETDRPPSMNEDRATPDILSMQDDLDPADRKLGELLKQLELVDPDTLNALWGEARRQHRPLRQVLLSGSYLTLYQLALIETGNLSGLVLGRFRVFDRLQSSPRESIYRVFDGQMANVDADRAICVLRHLGELEMHNAVRPDEYRQRFSAVRDLAHPNLAATREVLEVNGRPAVAQDWLQGLPGNEFPTAAGTPGVWYRLISQASVGLHTAHQAGLVHGRLTADALLLTREGVLKITGLGEPAWLHSATSAEEPMPEDDLRALGEIVHAWAGPSLKKKGRKGLPESLQNVLRGLGVDMGDGIPAALYPNTSALLEDLDQASRDVPADVASWEKLLEHVVENATEGPLMRKSA